MTSFILYFFGVIICETLSLNYIQVAYFLDLILISNFGMPFFYKKKKSYLFYDFSHYFYLTMQFD